MTKEQRYYEYFFKGIKHKDYHYQGGELIKVKLNDSFDNYLYHDVWLPAEVVAEYPKFIIVEILPHVNPNQHLGESHPYKIGINKLSIHFGDVNIKPMYK